MNNNLDNIKKILESEARLLIEDMSQSYINKIVDNRFSLIKQDVDSVLNKDDTFYIELIKLIGMYVEQLYDRAVIISNVIIFDKNGKIIPNNYDFLNKIDSFQLEVANNKLSEKLFDYVCDILECNKDIKLDIETLKRLFNRNPRPSIHSIERDYLYRFFDYAKLAKIINENQTLEKSNISIDDIYQLLLDTYQLNNNDVFGSLVKIEQFSQNHQKIDEILAWCNPETFAQVTNIIRCNFDKKFDTFGIAKKRNKNKFCDRLIIELLRHSSYYKDSCDLVHQILTDPEIEIDYNLLLNSHAGDTDLKSLIAFSYNKMIIKDLLSKKENIQNNYIWGDSVIRLYKLYVIIGDYEKALANFEEEYNFKYDLYDEDKNWDSHEYAYGSWSYKDSLADFISCICKSFTSENIEYSRKKKIINQILDSAKVEYINLEKTLPVLQEVLSDNDFRILLDTLVLKRNTGNLGFVSVTEIDSMFEHYIIKVASDEEVQNYLSSLNKDKSSNLKRIKKIQ